MKFRLLDRAAFHLTFVCQSTPLFPDVQCKTCNHLHSPSPLCQGASTYVRVPLLLNQESLVKYVTASRVNFSWSQVSTVARIPYSKTIYAILKTIMYTAKCLTASSNTDGATVTIQTCIDSEAQKWTFTGGAVQTFGDKCLDVTNGNNADGTKLQIWPCTPNDINQQFSYTVSYSL